MDATQPSPNTPDAAAPCALVVYESMFGNTSEVADAVADGLRAAGMRVAAHEVASAPGELGVDIDLVVLGAPTHAFSMSTAATRADAVRRGAPAARSSVGLRDWVQAVYWSKDLDVAIFDTRVAKVRHLPLTASRKTHTILTKRGVTVSTRPNSFLVEDLKGPLREGELDRARAWGTRLAAIAGTTRALKRHRTAPGPTQ